MKILLDTHILVWYFTDDKRLSQKALDIIADKSNEIYYSILSVWEVEIKYTTHPDRIPISGEQFLEYCRQLKFKQVPLDVAHILAVKTLVRREDTPPHRDPFDKLMICQAVVDNMLFITRDDRIAEYVSPMIFKI